MSKIRRSLTVAAVSCLVLSGLGLNASAEEPAPAVAPVAGRGAVVAPPVEESVARGLIVQTTTATPSEGALEATDDALGREAEVAAGSKITGKISTIGFDQEVPADVAAEVAEDVEKRADVLWAAPDTLRQTAETLPPVRADDYYFHSQWNLWDSAPSSSGGGFAVKAPALWQETKGADGVRVAVVDTGITNHPELLNQTVPGYDMIAADRSSSSRKTYVTAGDGNGRDANPSDPGDWTSKGQCYRNSPARESSWHGIFVAGQVAARTDNNMGIAGVAPNVKVQPVRVLGRCGGWDSDIIAGITWASGGHVAGVPDNTTPAQVVNLSLSGYAASSSARNKACAAYSAAANAGRARGSIFIAAAGNEGANANLAVPAACSGFVSVGATGRAGFSASYSNIGSSVDLVAPGGDRLVGGSPESIVSLHDTGTKSKKNFSFVRYEGTSMAAPQVAAGAALIYGILRENQPQKWDENGEPYKDDVTAAQLESAVYGTVAPFRPKSSSYARKKVTVGGRNYHLDLNCLGHNWCGRGMFDLSKVPVPLTNDVRVHEGGINTPISVSVGAWLGDQKFHYQWYRDGVPVGSDSRVHYPTADDVGASFSVTIRPWAAGYSIFTKRSEPSEPIKAGPVVNMTVPTAPLAYRASFTTTVTVAPRDGAGPGGGVGDAEVAVVSGGRPLAYATVVGGTAQVTVPGDQLSVGKNTLQAYYLGTGQPVETHAASSLLTSVQVSKSRSTTSASLRTRLRPRQRGMLKVRVRSTGIPNPTGTLKVYDGSRRIISTSLSSSAGGAKDIRLPRLRKGRHKIKVVYGGSAVVAGSASIRRSVRAY